MRTKFQLRMQTLMVLVLVPTLLVVIAGYGWINYRAVYQVILAGFNRKLDGISSASAAFVDGDAHQRLIVPRDIQAVAYDTVRKRIVGIDRGNGYLVSLEPETGSAEELTKLDRDPPFNARSAAFDEKRDRLVVLLDDGVSVLAVGPEDGKSSTIFTLAAPAGAVAYVPENDELFFAGEMLWRAPAEKPVVHAVGKLGAGSIQGLVWDPSAGNFIAIDSVSGVVSRVGAKDAGLTVVGNLIQDGNDSAVNIEEEEESKQWVEPQLVKLPAHGLAFDRETPALFAVTDRLIRVSPETGKGDPAGFRLGFRSDSSTLYNKFVEPMRRVMADRELTYHYTTILPRENQLVYVLDATDGEDHSAAGTEEEVDPAEWQRLERVYLSGVTSQSDIKQFDIWGLLKVGSAPIRDSKGDIVALMGADVDISTINKKTRVALLEVLFVGAISLLLAAIASVSVTRRLLKPLDRLKEAALQVAAGKYSRSLRIQRPKEVSQLAQAFDRVRNALCERMEALAENSKWFESHRRSHELMKLLARRADERSAGARCGVSAEFLGEAAQCRRASGWISFGESILVWLGQETLEPLRAARVRSDIATILSRLVERRGPQWERLRPELEPLFRNQVAAFLLLDGSEKAVYSLARARTTGTVISPEKESKVCLLIEHPKLVLEPGAQFVLSSRQSVNGHGAPKENDETELFAVMKAE